ncbi:hypothetical protein CARN8_4250002 [mine drainage metagenome]|uniref:Uncharacterized protein n=1 Tax=mine drainage metagenome TaxID=410659 RepID=A0A3P3ZPZ0_9ZZZZ
MGVVRTDYEPDPPVRLCMDCRFYIERRDLCWIPAPHKPEKASDARADPLSCGPDAVNWEDMHAREG